MSSDIIDEPDSFEHEPSLTIKEQETKSMSSMDDTPILLTGDNKNEDTINTIDNHDSFDSGAGNVVMHKTPRRRPLVKYEFVMWIIILTITSLACIDRFVWNVWPRQTYTIGAGSAGSDRLEGYKPGPWSVKLYDALARVSGRYAIIAYNFLLITRLKSLEFALMKNSFVSRYLLDCSNIVHANNRLHNWTGIGLCVLTLLHVWSILFPCLTHGYTAKVVPGAWEWPASERTPVKCSVSDEPGCWPGDANVELKQMGLQVDDVFRMVEMTIFLMILMPISVRWLATRWHAAIQLHRVINVVYFVDIVRRHSHPHSWILNTPVFFLYCMDAFVWANYWRRNTLPEVKRIKLGQDYMVLLWKSRFSSSKQIAPHYSIVMQKHDVLEEKHIFTCFENRLQVPLPQQTSSEVMKEDDIDDPVKDKTFEWNAGCVIRVFRTPRQPRLGKLERYSHTMRMYEEDPDYIITGPTPGEMSLKLQSAYELSRGHKTIMLIGAGSAVNYIFDFLLWLGSTHARHNHPTDDNGETAHPIAVIYTTRDDDLFEWAAASLAAVLDHLPDELSQQVDLQLSHTGEMELFGEEGRSSSLHASKHSLHASCRSISFYDQRIDLDREIKSHCKVFCQGSGAFKSAVKKRCDHVKASFFGGEGGH